MIGKLLIYWDYELQKGADSRYIKSNNWNGYEEYNQTEKLLKLLKEFKIKTTFTVLGHAAEKGKLPYHAPEQIKQMSEDGHEVASHSQNHEYLPDINEEKLIYTLRTSKENIEKVIKKKIYSFVPPYNMPLSYFGISLKLKPNKFIRLSKLTVNKLLSLLSSIGYKTCRINKFTPIANKVFNKYRSYKPNRIENVLTVSLNCHAGFLDDAKQVVNHAVKTGNVAVIYAHPHSLGKEGRQNINNLKSFLAYVKNLEKEKKLEITTPYELYKKLFPDNAVEKP